jgi:hypothetical protein
MNPAPARKSNPYGVELTPEELAKFFEKHVRVYNADGYITVVVSVPPESDGVASVVTCTHPPCW